MIRGGQYSTACPSSFGVGNNRGWHISCSLRLIALRSRPRETLKIEISFYGFVRDLVNPSKLIIDTPDRTSLREVLDLAAKKHGERLRERLLTASGDLASNVQVFIGEDPTISLDQPIEHRLDPSPEVKVFVLSATAGG